MSGARRKRGQQAPDQRQRAQSAQSPSVWSRHTSSTLGFATSPLYRQTGLKLARKRKIVFVVFARFDRLHEPDAILICVPTPLTKHREPDLSFVVHTAQTEVSVGQGEDRLELRNARGVETSFDDPVLVGREIVVVSNPAPAGSARRLRRSGRSIWSGRMRTT